MSKGKNYWVWQDTVIVVLGLMAIGFTLYHYPQLPDKIPAHYNASGEVDRYDSKALVLGMLAGIGLLLPLLLSLLRRLDPKKTNYSAFANAFGMTRLALAVVLDSALVITVLKGLGQEIPINKMFFFLLGLTFVVIGNYLPQVKSNYFIGIRTAWTLNNAEVWRRTHRVSGPVWFVGGFVLIAGAFLPDAWGYVVLAAVFTVCAGVPILYSWQISKSV